LVSLREEVLFDNVDGLVTWREPVQEQDGSFLAVLWLSELLMQV
jgi:hypothetical protein